MEKREDDGLSIFDQRSYTQKTLLGTNPTDKVAVQLSDKQLKKLELMLCIKLGGKTIEKFEKSIDVTKAVMSPGLSIEMPHDMNSDRSLNNIPIGIQSPQILSSIRSPKATSLSRNSFMVSSATGSMGKAMSGADVDSAKEENPEEDTRHPATVEADSSNCRITSGRVLSCIALSIKVNFDSYY